MDEVVGRRDFPDLVTNRLFFHTILSWRGIISRLLALGVLVVVTLKNEAVKTRSG